MKALVYVLYNGVLGVLPKGISIDATEKHIHRVVHAAIRRKHPRARLCALFVVDRFTNMNVIFVRPRAA